ncbi:MAG: sialate O-acetylesterase [Prosthecobacter sp.]|nr:sialate O-acetylesterase [Prosthecobacter sp.]
MIRPLSLLVCLQILPFFPGLAQEVTLPPKDRFHLYLLVGQSNMAGRGEVTPEDQKPHARVLSFGKSDTWAPATEPLHWDKPAAGVGPGLAFGREIMRANPKIAVGLIPCAVGGSPIDAWQPGVYYTPTKSHPWDDAIRRAKLALKDGTLKGILWHQGESDCKTELASAYEPKLHDLIKRLRTALQAPDVPFIVGQMGKFPSKPWSPGAELVDQAHRSLPKKVAGTAYVGSEGLTDKGDGIHFDAASYRELGRRYAEAWQQLQRRSGSP